MNLAKDAVLRVSGPGVVQVGRGRVWITRERDPADYFVAAGESFLLEGAGSVVISAIRDSSFVMVPSRRPVFRWRALGRTISPS